MNLNALILFLCGLSTSHLSYAQPLRRALLGDTVAAVCAYKCPDKDYMASRDALLPVRCCSDTAVDHWTQNKGCAAWAQSRLSGHQCFTENFASAQGICRKNGGRLCTQDEVKSGCTRHTGCGFDTHQIWTHVRVQSNHAIEAF